MWGFLLGGAYLTYFIVIPRKRGIPLSQLKPQDPGFRRDDDSLQPRGDPGVRRDDKENIRDDGKLPHRLSAVPPLHYGEGDYFFTAQNRASSHPMPVHPNTHDAMRMRMATAFGFSDLAAKYAGASIIATSVIVATIYLIIKMCSGLSASFYFPYVALLPNSSSIRNN